MIVLPHEVTAKNKLDRACEALGTIPGPWPTESTQQMLAAVRSFMLQALGTRYALVATLLSHFLSSPSALCLQS